MWTNTALASISIFKKYRTIPLKNHFALPLALTLTILASRLLLNKRPSSCPKELSAFEDIIRSECVPTDPLCKHIIPFLPTEDLKELYDRTVSMSVWVNLFDLKSYPLFQGTVGKLHPHTFCTFFGKIKIFLQISYT